MCFDTFPKYTQARSYLNQAFAHAFPFDLEPVPVVDDVPKAPEGPELQGEAVVEEHGQRRLARLAKPFKQLEVPVFAGRQFNAMKTAQTFENILEARVELRQESRRRRFLSDGGLAAGDVMHQRS